MASLSGLKVDADVEVGKDTLGGGGYLRDSGVYKMKIDTAFMDVSKKGATALKLIFKDKAGTFKTDLWVLSNDAKGNKPYYERDGKKIIMMGMNVANAICQLTLGKDLGDLDTEKAVIKVWDSTAGKELPKEKQVVTALLDQEVQLGLIKQTVSINIKNDNGAYVPGPETREENEIDRVFGADNDLTMVELKAGETKGVFVDKWKEKWEGEVKDKTKKPQGGVATPPKVVAQPADDPFA